MRRKSIFATQDAAERIRQTVEEVESRTDGEILVASAERSDTYRDPLYLAGAAIAWLFLWVFVYHPAPFNNLVFILLQANVFLFAVFACGKIRILHRLFVSQSAMKNAVERRSAAAFYELGLAQTRARGGVLVFLSLFERRVRILADIAFVDSDFMKTITALQGAMSLAMKDDDLEGFLKQLRLLEEMMVERLPAVPNDDRDQLPNHVVRLS